MTDIDDLARRAGAAARADSARIANTEQALADVGQSTRSSRWPLVVLAAALVLAVAAIGVWTLTGDEPPGVVGTPSTLETTTAPSAPTATSAALPSSTTVAGIIGPWEDAGFTFASLPRDAVFESAYLSRDNYDYPVWVGRWALPNGSLTLERASGRTNPASGPLPRPGATTSIDQIGGRDVIVKETGWLAWAEGGATISVSAINIPSVEVREFIAGLSYDPAKDQYRSRLPSGPYNETLYPL